MTAGKVMENISRDNETGVEFETPLVLRTGLINISVQCTVDCSNLVLKKSPKFSSVKYILG